MGDIIDGMIRQRYNAQREFTQEDIERYHIMILPYEQKISQPGVLLERAELAHLETITAEIWAVYTRESILGSPLPREIARIEGTHNSRESALYNERLMLELKTLDRQIFIDHIPELARGRAFVRRAEICAELYPSRCAQFTSRAIL
jgi:hypothetical protein